MNNGMDLKKLSKSSRMRIGPILTSILITIQLNATEILIDQTDDEKLSQESQTPHHLEVNKHILLLYYSPYCPYSQEVLNYMEINHKKIPLCNIIANPEAKKQLEQIGGKALVPCLIVDETAIYNSSAIIEWLNENEH